MTVTTENKIETPLSEVSLIVVIVFQRTEVFLFVDVIIYKLNIKIFSYFKRLSFTLFILLLKAKKKRITKHVNTVGKLQSLSHVVALVMHRICVFMKSVFF
jgi:hypothetical protein